MYCICFLMIRSLERPLVVVRSCRSGAAVPAQAAAASPPSQALSALALAQAALTSATAQEAAVEAIREALRLQEVTDRFSKGLFIIDEKNPFPLAGQQLVFVAIIIGLVRQLRGEI